MEVYKYDFFNIFKQICANQDNMQKQFARELNVFLSTVNRWGNGHTAPSDLTKMCFLEFC
jgi:DNA-binding transcriptional regulator YiaG